MQTTTVAKTTQELGLAPCQRLYSSTGRIGVIKVVGADFVLLEVPRQNGYLRVTTDRIKKRHDENKPAQNPT